MNTKNAVAPPYIAQCIVDYLIRAGGGEIESAASELAQQIWDAVLADETKMVIFNVQLTPDGVLEGEHLREGFK